MKIRPRKFFDQEPVKQALEDYLRLWENLLDDKKGQQMMADHVNELTREIDELKARHKKLFKEYGATDDPATQHVIKVAMEHANRNISILQRVRREPTDFIQAFLKTEAQGVLKMFRQGDRMIFDRDGNLKSDYIKKLFAKSRPETWERNAELDAIYETGKEFAIEAVDREERAYQLAKIPREIRRAKWKFMLALADAAYSIDMGHLGGESINPNHLILLSDLFARLSDHERGADNDTMAHTHKLRHNPAIHSLHTLALADKIFHQVMKNLESDPSLFNGKKDAMIGKLKKMRSQIFVTALVHDMGEIDGELSQGINVAHADKALKDKIEQVRNHRERETFLSHLNHNLDELHHNQGDHLTRKPISEREKDTTRLQYMEAFDLSEDTDRFMGRFFKTIERLQSNHDYMRFQGLNGATPLRNTDDANKTFSTNYVPRIFYDANWDSVAKGPRSLANLARKDADDVGVTLQKMLTTELEKEVTHLTQHSIEGYYGENSPQMTKFKRVSHQRDQAVRGR